jgi:hypothetical protein
MSRAGSHVAKVFSTTLCTRDRDCLGASVSGLANTDADSSLFQELLDQAQPDDGFTTTGSKRADSYITVIEDWYRLMFQMQYDASRLLHRVHNRMILRADNSKIRSN